MLFLGQETRRDVLVAEGLERTVLYGGGGELLRSNLAFVLYLDYLGLYTDPKALEPDVQAMADPIVASFARVR